jgi:hypothetical protein
MERALRRAISLAVVSLLVASAAACGGSSDAASPSALPALSTLSAVAGRKLAVKILLEADKSALDASSVHVEGKVPADGTTAHIDMRLSDPAGSGVIGMAPNALVMRRIGQTAYYKGGPLFWRQFVGPQADTSQLVGRWLKVPAGMQSGDIIKLTMKAKTLTGILGPAGELSYSGTKTFRGQQVIVLSDDLGGDFYISAAKPHYPVAIVDEERNGTLYFDGWNQPVNVEPPPNPLTLNALQQGASA